MATKTEFTGKRALVTGGTRGIGEAIVQQGGRTVLQIHTPTNE
jgi:NAD(P)-dependent dehydrogenase (short-subunit alcohol dehydrogenase family)